MREGRGGVSTFSKHPRGAGALETTRPRALELLKSVRRGQRSSTTVASKRSGSGNLSAFPEG